MTCAFKKLETDIVIDFNWSEAKSKWFQRKKRNDRRREETSGELTTWATPAVISRAAAGEANSYWQARQATATLHL